MMNGFIIRKYSTLLLVPLINSIIFFIGLKYYGFFIGLGCLGFGLLITTLMGVLLLKNPFTDMLEGKGILTLDINSTGIIGSYISAVKSPYIITKIGKDYKKDVFDRKNVFQLSQPTKAGIAEMTKEGGLNINLNQDEYNKAKFVFNQYPVIIWNSQLQSTVTKDFLSEKEQTSFAKHAVLYLNRKVEELTSAVRDFGRYAVELTKPQKGGLMGNKIAIIIIIIVIIILAALFAPAIIKSISSFGGSASEAVKTAGGVATGAAKGVITPA
jgi:hypothetical protein